MCCYKYHRSRATDKSVACIWRKSNSQGKKVVYNFKQWIFFMYRDTNFGRGKVHAYLSMNLYYIKKGKVKIEMRKYVENMTVEFILNTYKYRWQQARKLTNCLRWMEVRPWTIIKRDFFLQLWLQVYSYEIEQYQTFSPLLR